MVASFNEEISNSGIYYYPNTGLLDDLVFKVAHDSSILISLALAPNNEEYLKLVGRRIVSKPRDLLVEFPNLQKRINQYEISSGKKIEDNKLGDLLTYAIGERYDVNCFWNLDFNFSEGLNINLNGGPRVYKDGINGISWLAGSNPELFSRKFPYCGISFTGIGGNAIERDSAEIAIRNFSAKAGYRVNYLHIGVPNEKIDIYANLFPFGKDKVNFDVSWPRDFPKKDLFDFSDNKKSNVRVGSNSEELFQEIISGFVPQVSHCD